MSNVHAVFLSLSLFLLISKGMKRAKMSRVIWNLLSMKTSIQGLWEVLYIVAYKERLLSEGVLFSRAMEFLISVCKKAQKGLQMHFMAVKKWRKRLCL